MSPSSSLSSEEVLMWIKDESDGESPALPGPSNNLFLSQNEINELVGHPQPAGLCPKAQLRDRISTNSHPNDLSSSSVNRVNGARRIGYDNVPSIQPFINLVHSRDESNDLATLDDYIDLDLRPHLANNLDVDSLHDSSDNIAFLNDSFDNSGLSNNRNTNGNCFNDMAHITSGSSLINPTNISIENNGRFTPPISYLCRNNDRLLVPTHSISPITPVPNYVNHVSEPSESEPSCSTNSSPSSSISCIRLGSCDQITCVYSGSKDLFQDCSSSRHSNGSTTQQESYCTVNNSESPCDPYHLLRKIFDDKKIGTSLMLISSSELAHGDSLTCTVVNILRALHLLDRCGVVDLCASLYDFWNTGCSTFIHKSEATLVAHHPVSIPHKYHTCDNVVTRSSSFTSSSLVESRWFTISSDQSDYTNHNLFSHSKRLQVKKESCLINYLLACSYNGTSFLAPQEPPGSTGQTCSFGPVSSDFSPVPNHLFNTSNRSPSFLRKSAHFCCNSGIGWRRGRADCLVMLLTSHSWNLKSSPSLVSKLLTGRFFAGPNGWSSIWPPDYPNYLLPSNSCKSITPDYLALWFSAWIKCGAVPVLAQLSHTNPHLPTKLTTPIQDTGVKFSSSSHVSSELYWTHRLVYGVTANGHVYLSNPTELVPVVYVMEQLAKQTELRIQKNQISQLWARHYLQSKPWGLADRNTNHQSMSQCRSKFFSGEGLSLLAQQRDPRWISMNIMGQVLSMLRDLERWTETHEQFPNDLTSYLPDSTSSAHISFKHKVEMEQFSTSIIIPSSQVPGISLFVAKSNWDLVHTLFHNTPNKSVM